MDKIQNNKVFKQVLADSFGGVLYNVANRQKYDSDELLKLWASLTESEKEMAGGITKGAIQFLQGN
jgi:hypothetical protein